VTALIEPRKIDVLFADRIRRLIHSRGRRVELSMRFQTDQGRVTKRGPGFLGSELI